MEKQVSQVLEFHTRYRMNIENTPCVPSKERRKLRKSLIKEETNELVDAINKKDLVKVADGIIDSMYVILGTAIEFGMGDIVEKMFDEVHRSNMTKLGDDGNPVYREDGKVTKGPNFTPPNLEAIIEDKQNQ